MCVHISQSGELRIEDFVFVADADFIAYDLTSEVETYPTGTDFVVAIFNLQRAVRVNN